jgi:hypothetical protein
MSTLAQVGDEAPILRLISRTGAPREIRYALAATNEEGRIELFGRLPLPTTETGQYPTLAEAVDELARRNGAHDAVSLHVIRVTYVSEGLLKDHPVWRSLNQRKGGRDHEARP